MACILLENVGIFDLFIRSLGDEEYLKRAPNFNSKKKVQIQIQFLHQIKSKSFLFRIEL